MPQIGDTVGAVHHPCVDAACSAKRMEIAKALPHTSTGGSTHPSSVVIEWVLWRRPCHSPGREPWRSPVWMRRCTCSDVSVLDSFLPLRCTQAHDVGRGRARVAGAALPRAAGGNGSMRSPREPGAGLLARTCGPAAPCDSLRRLTGGPAEPPSCHACRLSAVRPDGSSCTAVLRGAARRGRQHHQDEQRWGCARRQATSWCTSGSGAARKDGALMTLPGRPLAVWW